MCLTSLKVCNGDWKLVIRDMCELAISATGMMLYVIIWTRARGVVGAFTPPKYALGSLTPPKMTWLLTTSAKLIGTYCSELAQLADTTLLPSYQLAHLFISELDLSLNSLHKPLHALL